MFVNNLHVCKYVFLEVGISNPINGDSALQEKKLSFSYFLALILRAYEHCI